MQHNAPKDQDDKPVKALGKTAANAFRDKRISDVEVVVSHKIDPAQLSQFYHSFHLANFNYSEKSHLDFEFDGDASDQRCDRTKITVDSLTLTHEKLDEASFKFEAAAISATNLSRDLANVRGTEADCEYMERQVHQLID